MFCLTCKDLALHSTPLSCYIEGNTECFSNLQCKLSSGRIRRKEGRKHTAGCHKELVAAEQGIFEPKCKTNFVVAVGDKILPFYHTSFIIGEGPVACAGFCPCASSVSYVFKINSECIGKSLKLLEIKVEYYNTIFESATKHTELESCVGRYR